MSSETPGSTPAQDEAVRRQLAAARHDEPVPEAVVQRLDRVLAGLADERVPTPVGDPVVDLASRRRRRRVTQLLVAAVAIVAVGFGFGELSGSMGGSDDSASSADAGFERNSDSAGGDTKSSEAPEVGPASSPDDLTVVTSKGFRKELARLRAATTDAAALDDRAYLQATTEAACVKPSSGERAVAVEFRGALATLMYRAPVADRQQVDLYRCDPPVLLRSIMIPGP